MLRSSLHGAIVAGLNQWDWACRSGRDTVRS